MPARDWKLRIEAVGRIQTYTTNYDLNKFAADLKTVDAVVRNLEVIGEAARYIPSEIESKHPEVPWAEMRGLRNVLAHEYFGVNTAILWHTVVQDLPPVIAMLQRILSVEGRS